MGGGVWKLGRLPRENYMEIEQEIRAFLDEQFGPDSYRIPRYYGSKPDFGDMDVLLSNEIIAMNGDWTSVEKQIVEGLGTQKYKGIGKGMFSTVYRDFQVDFFRTSDMETMSSFMDFNDLGNLIGRLFRPFGLKYSEKGLSYVYRSGGYHEEMTLSTDFKEILTFVDLNYKAWERGFDHIEEMFEWIVSSRYFRSDPYTYPTSRVVKKGAYGRRTIRLFLQFIKDHEIQREPTFLDKEQYLDIIDRTWPEAKLKEMIARVQKLDEDDAVVRAKFNGNLAMEWVPGMKGKELGAWMSRFKELHPREKLLQMDPDRVRTLFLQLHNDVTNKGLAD